MLRMLVLGALGLWLATLASAQGLVHTYSPPVKVKVAPPAVKVERPPIAPSPSHVWLAGHWAWRDHRHLWVPGQWAVAPAPGYTWVAPRWVPESGQWVYYEGYWTTPVVATPTVIYEPAPPPKPIVVMVAPPSPIVEVRPAVPFPGAVWIPGYWHWSGSQYVWLTGRWSAARPHAHWAPAHWKRAGREWHFVPGHWKKG